MASSEPKPSKSRSKDKRKRSQLLQQDQSLDQQQASAPKKTKPSSPWANLDLILSLQRNDLDIQRKLELASEFIGSDVGVNDGRQQPVPISRLASFLIDWTQPLLIPREKSSGLCVHCLDCRCWALLRFCLKNSQVSVSLNLIKSVTQVFKYSEDSTDGKRLFDSVRECFELILSTNPRVFYNASMDLWSPCVVEIVGAVRKSSVNDDDDVVLRLSHLLLEHFVNFLRFHKDPTNVFSKFVNGLLEPLLELLVLLHLRTKDGKCRQFGSLLRLVEDVLSNGLFHPANIGGFFSLKSSNAEQKTWAPKGQREFFKKLGNIITEKKAMTLWGFGNLFRLFVASAKTQKGAYLVAKSDQALAKSSEISDERKETSKPLFEVFVQFMQPLVLECKRFSEKELSESEEVIEDRLLEAHGMLKSLNETLVSFIQEKIYTRTEDTSDGGHYNFLKEVYETVVAISGKIYQLWLSMKDMDGDKVKKMLPLVAREVVAAVGCFLEIEYKVVEDDLVKLWVIMVSYLAVHLSVEDTKSSSPLTSDILNLGSKLINIYSELRQVNSPLFALCKAARILKNDACADASDYSMFVYSSVSSHIYIKSVGTLFCSQELQVAISNAIKSIPEGQASGCVQQLEVDVKDSLQWIKFNPSGFDGKNVTETDDLNVSITYLDMQIEILGRLLSEVYSTVLDSLTVTASYSISVGNSIKNLMETVGLSFSNLVQIPSGSVDKFILSINGRRLCDHEKSEIDGGIWIRPLSISWLLVFFFRMYISCRSLYRQLTSLMPPVSAVKAAKSMGNFFMVAHEGDWKERPEVMDEGYFSWIVKPSISLLDLIKFHLEDFLSSTGCPSLHYVIYIMALQRLSDLNRLIKAFEYLQRRDVNESSEKLRRLIVDSKQEATELANFLLRSGKLLDCKGHLISVQHDGLADTKPSYDHAWDLSVSSLNRSSLHTAIWRLLCRDIDIWCAHAAKKYLKKFLSCLFCYSIQEVKCSGVVSGQSAREFSCQKVTMHHVSMEFLANIVSYEQSPLCQQFTSGFGRILEELLAPILSHVCAKKMDLGSLPDWSEFLNIMKKEQFIGWVEEISSLDHPSLFPNPNLDLPGKNMDLNDRETSSFISELGTVESLLTLLSKIPKVQLNAKSFSVYASYSLNLERLAVSCLLKHGTNSSLCKAYELVRLFISCRRFMKFLVSASLDDSGATGSASISSVFGSSDSILWLLESVSGVVGLPHALFGVTHSSWLQDVVFPLIDHTSCIFLAISEKQMSAIKKTKINDKKLLTEHSVDIMAEILKDQARNLFASIGSLQEIKLEDHVGVLSCSRFAVIISCFQGFLWGLVSAFDCINQDISTVNPQYSRLIPACLPELSKCITLYEEIINLCFNIDNKTESICFLHNILNATEFERDPGNHPGTSTEATKLSCLTVNHDNNPSDWAFSESPVCNDKKVIPLDTAGKAKLVNEVQETNLLKLKNLKRPLLESLLKNEDSQIAYTFGKIFTASAAILKLKSLLRFPRSVGSKVWYSKVAVNSLHVLETSILILKEMAELVGRLEPVSFVCLEGILTFLEAVGSSSGDLKLSEDFFTQLIDTHLRAIGKCISLQGKSATLSSHETGSSSKMLRSHNELNTNSMDLLDQNKFRINAFKARLRISFKNFIVPKKFDLMIALQLLERALVGARHDCNIVYDITTGSLDGGEVSSTVAAGIDCLELVLESLSGHELVVGKTLSFINAVFNIILHLQNPTIFYLEKQLNYKIDIKPDVGSVILMCVQVLTSIAGNKSVQMEAWHVSQCLHIPLALFTGFYQLKNSFPSSGTDTFFDNQKVESSGDMYCNIVDHKFSVDLYASCCRLLCTTLNHRQRHAEQCIAILEESVSTLLNCLEMVDTELIRGKSYFAWELEEALKCASYLRRIYEEIRNEKDVFAEHSSYFLSNYISVYSGCGPLKTGIKREVDEALRPGVYSLIDVCGKADFKRIHTAFGEGPCRSTLKTLLHDFNVNFKYKGKI